MTREVQVAFEEMRMRIGELERQIIELRAQPQAATPLLRRGEPRWLSFVKYGGKACPGGCGTVVPAGETRAWYEPAGPHGRAQVFCESCGTQREQQAVAA